jgi:putative membrane protein
MSVTDLILHPFHLRAFVFHQHWIWGLGILVWLAQVALFVGILVLVVMLLRRDRHHRRFEARPPSLTILEERYARGEISREEFLERRSVLLGQAPPPGSSGPAGATGPASPSPSGS